MKKLPQRMCTVCRESKSKFELIRIVRSPEGEISIDLTGKKSGRGAYICRSSACLQKAQKQRSLERSLKCRIPEEIWEQLAQAMEAKKDGAE
jgi:predicted RNA-binding protein YlxR (DUF448 family)